MLDLAIDLSTSRPLRRRGISLLEVLFSTFILAMGMLGLGALIPVGNYQVSQGLRMDHAATCARAAFREIEAREMLRPDNWVMADGTPAAGPPGVVTPSPGNFFQMPTFMLDPLFLANNPAVPQFPSGGAAVMPRLSLRSLPINSNPLDAARANSIFSWRDDLSMGDNNGERPQLINNAGVTASEGNYSWMAMVTPSAVENTARLGIGQRRSYTVSVIVFNKRDLVSTTQAVRQFGGASVTFTPPSDLRIDTTGPSGEPRKIVAGQWIMLSEQYPSPADPSINESRHCWYRVVAVGNVPGTPQYRVRLAGPNWVARSGSPPLVTVADGVIGVFERTVELDTNSAMSAP